MPTGIDWERGLLRLDVGAAPTMKGWDDWRERGSGAFDTFGISNPF
jgi:hypothetical protein